MPALIGKIITFATGNKWLLVAAGVLILAAFGVYKYQDWCIEKLTAANNVLTLEQVELKAAIQGQDAVIEHLQESQKRNDTLISETAKKQAALAAQNRKLESRLAEAIKNAKNIEIDVVMPDSIADALCLRWNSASGVLTTGDNQGNTTRSASIGADYPITTLCRGWYGRVTLSDLLEWNGELLDHAGAERLDKIAVRVWSKERK